MIKYSFSFLIILLAFQLNAQDCNEGNHSINNRDSWVSCEKTMNPNPARGNTHWVRYDLGYVYSITTTHFWNYNVDEETSKGMKNITIDYSLDGTNWLEAATFQLSEATGMPAYEGISGPDLGSIDARYILISSTDSWGDLDCAGLSEVRFDVDGIVALTETDDKKLELDLFPNPAGNSLSIGANFEIKEMVILNTSGHEIQRLPFASTIDVGMFPNGVYFLKCINSDNEIITKRFIKQ